MSTGIEILKALAEPTRLRMLRLILTSPAEPCACELADALLEPPTDVSRHVRVLKFTGLVKERREGKWVYYGPGPVAVRRKQALLSLCEEAVQPSQAAADRKRFRARLKLRESGKCLIGIQNPVLLKQLGRA